MSRFYSRPGNEYKIAGDCRFFPGDRPCIYHKKEGVSCTCEHYAKIEKRVVIIKLGALGDVLRTTPLIGALKEKYPDAHITWIVDQSNAGYLAGAPGLDRVMTLNPETLLILDVEEFDLLYSLEVSIAAGALATKIKAAEKHGFGLSPDGTLMAFDPASANYLLMSLSDPVKKANRRTYLEIFSDICDLPLLSHNYLVAYGEDEKKKVEEFSLRNHLENEELLIGFFTGAGGRWKSKRWPKENYLKLLQLMKDELPGRVLLYGGPEEAETMQYLEKEAPGRVISTGSDNSLRQFFAYLDLCELLLTPDTMPMHAAFGLGKKVVALFGPTSMPEIDTFGRGIKMAVDMPCITCYLPDCDVSPNCMEKLEPEKVLPAIKKLLR